MYTTHCTHYPSMPNYLMKTDLIKMQNFSHNLLSIHPAIYILLDIITEICKTIWKYVSTVHDQNSNTCIELKVLPAKHVT